MKGFPAAAHESLQDSQLRRNLGKATQTIRAKRLRTIQELPDWEQLREAGAAIKARAMATLPEQLERLEASVQRAVDRYAARYRTPKPNPLRVALRIEVDRFLVSGGLV